jgi:polyphosphate glucokinase
MIPNDGVIFDRAKSHAFNRQPCETKDPFMKVLAIDIGGTHVKILMTGQKEHRELESGLKLTPTIMVAGVRNLAKDWNYDVVSIGYPGPVCHNQPLSEPWNLGRGWVGFDYPAAFERPVKIINDAAIQAMGSYLRGRMLFLGLGTGFGSAMIVDGILEPMELGHLPFKRGRRSRIMSGFAV